MILWGCIVFIIYQKSFSISPSQSVWFKLRDKVCRSLSDIKQIIKIGLFILWRNKCLFERKNNVSPKLTVDDIIHITNETCSKGGPTDKATYFK